jgi:hypothetical protein
MKLDFNSNDEPFAAAIIEEDPRDARSRRQAV